jgi:hypothetical protein
MELSHDDNGDDSLSVDVLKLSGCQSMQLIDCEALSTVVESRVRDCCDSFRPGHVSPIFSHHQRVHIFGGRLNDSEASRNTVRYN